MDECVQLQPPTSSGRGSSTRHYKLKISLSLQDTESNTQILPTLSTSLFLIRIGSISKATVLKCLLRFLYPEKLFAIENPDTNGRQICFKDSVCDMIEPQRYGRAYQLSKLANVLHANELSRRLMEEGANITANSLDPGVVRTDILQYNPFLQAMVSMFCKMIIKDVQQGAATTCYVALHPQVKGVTGEYFSNSNLSKAAPHASNKNLAKKLWQFSMNLINNHSH